MEPEELSLIVDTSAPDAPAAPEKAGDKKRKLIIGAIAAGIILVLSAAWILIISIKDRAYEAALYEAGNIR